MDRRWIFAVVLALLLTPETWQSAAAQSVPSTTPEPIVPSAADEAKRRAMKEFSEGQREFIRERIADCNRLLEEVPPSSSVSKARRSIKQWLGIPLNAYDERENARDETRKRCGGVVSHQ